MSCGASDLWSCDDTLSLSSSSNETTANSGKIRIRSQTLPVSSTSCNTSNRANKRSKGHVNALTAILTSECMTVPQHKVSVESGSKVDAGRE